MQNNSFEDRLQRIQAAREQGADSQAQARPQRRGPASQPARSDALARVVLGIGIGVIVLAVGGGFLVWNRSAEPGQSTDETIAAAAVDPADTAGVSPETPAQDAPRKLIAPPGPTRADRALARIPAGAAGYLDRMGREYSPDVVVDAAGEALAPEAVGFDSVPVGPDTDFKFNHIRQNSSCRLKPVAASSKLVNVLVAGSPRTAPLQYLRDGRMTSDLTAQIRAQLANGQAPHDLEIDRGPVEAIDLYVTDTSAPLHLVLQTQAKNVVWNLHVAPGVTIDHVAMIANGRSAVTGGHFEVRRYEALDASRFIQAERVLGSNNKGLPDCMPLPIRKPDESWGAWEGAMKDGTRERTLVDSMTNAFYAYDRWYKENLGASPETNLISVQSAAQVLVGPAPAAAPAAAAGAGKTLRGYAAFDDTVITGSAGARDLQLNVHILKILSAAADEDPMHLFDQVIPIAQPADAAPLAPVDLHEEEAPLLMRALKLDPAGASNLRQITDMSAPNLSRRVRIAETIDFSALLRPDEPVPDDDLRDLYALLRLPEFMQHHCPDTLGTIASSCKVAAVSTETIIGDRIGVTADIAYVPNYEIGQFAPVQNGAFVAIKVPSGTASAIPAEPAARKAYLERVARLCDAMRERHGTCVIHYAGFEPPEGRSSPSQVTASAAISVYGVNNSAERGKLEGEVAALWPTL